MILDILNYFENIPHLFSAEYRIFSYLILFLVMVIENGLFFVPFLPGDSLLFLSGALFSYTSFAEIGGLFLLLTIGAILGDLVNYILGRWLGKEVLMHRWINKVYLNKTHQYFKDYGNKTIVLARFVPVVRGIAPLMAGAGKMNTKDFMRYNIFGGIIWTGIFLFAGYFFGNIPFVRENLLYFILGVIVVSFIPIIYFIIKEFRKTK